MEELYDVTVIGGGPAGLTAAIYLARAGYRVLVLEKEQFGGQIAITHQVVNYPGVEKISGGELSETMRRQAEAFGAELVLTEATGLETAGDIKTVHTRRGDYRCFGILLATGARPRTVGFQGEDQYKGRGVAYCATCDGQFFTGREVFVVGGGYAAAEESVFLAKFARHVTILIRKGDFSCAPSVAEKAKNHEKITVLTNTVLEAVSGGDGLQYARYKNTVTGEVTEYRCGAGEYFGVFVFAGYVPATEAFRDAVALDAQGCVVTGAGLNTNAEGVYAAGDVRAKPLRQVVTATGDGALAAAALERHAEAMRRKTGLCPQMPGEKPATHEPGAADSDTGPFSEAVKRQLEGVFSRMERRLLLELSLDGRPVSAELERFIRALAALTDRLDLRMAEHPAPGELLPCVRILREDGSPTGLAFHGVPAGHEFTPFVLGLYNAAGPGQPLEEGLRARIAGLKSPVEIKILITLSCSMCPDTVTAAQRIAAENPYVTAEAYDVRHFEDLRSRYAVMSVPCLVINGERVAFGRKNLEGILDLIQGKTP